MSIAAALRAVQRPFAVVGGLAISVRGEPRFTRDVDVAVWTVQMPSTWSW
jgi:hypothetical protein